MSRNLCRKDCHFCGGVVVLEERPRPITKEDAGVYFDDYEGMVVANAHCEDCEALYLAWVDETKRLKYASFARQMYEGDTHVDLSYRHAFDDEPDDEDLPKFEMIRVRREIPVCTACGVRRAPGYEYQHRECVNPQPEVPPASTAQQPSQPSHEPATPAPGRTEPDKP